MNEENKLTGAGVVPIFDNRDRKFSDLPEDVLYLVLHDRKGGYDFPKGGIDSKHGELPYDCAVREMQEECNLKLSDFNNKCLSGNTTEEGFMCGDRLLMFFGVVDNIANVKINPNPEIKAKKGIDFYEHKGFSWLPYDQIISKESECLLHYLVPAIKAAKDWFNKNS